MSCRWWAERMMECKCNTRLTLFAFQDVMPYSAVHSYSLFQNSTKLNERGNLSGKTKYTSRIISKVKEIMLSIIVLLSQLRISNFIFENKVNHPHFSSLVTTFQEISLSHYPACNLKPSVNLRNVIELELTS